MKQEIIKSELRINKLFLTELKDQLPKVLKFVKAIEDLQQEQYTKELRDLLIALTRFSIVVTQEKRTKQQELNDTILIKNKGFGLPYNAYLKIL